MNSNKIDSIQKLSREELEESRKLILETIGEGASSKKSTEAKAKKIDSLSLAKEKNISPDGISAKNKGNWRREKPRQSKPAPPLRQKTTFAPDFIKQAPLDDIRRPLPAPPRAAPARKNSTPGSAERENNKKEAAVRQIQSAKLKAANDSGEQARKAEKNKAELKARTKRKQALLKEAAKRKQIADRKKNQEKKRKVRGDAWANIKKTFASVSSRAKKSARQSLFLFFAMLLSVVLCYSIYIALILKLNYDNSAARKISRIFPVPVLITASGFMNYYQYKDLTSQMKNGYNGPEEIKQAVKINFSRDIIINDLIKKYGIKNENFKIEDLSDKIIYDFEVNQVAINRIQKIKQMIEANSDFVKIADKYGDEQGKLVILIADENKYSYIDKVKNLSIGEISDIALTPEGYYIFRCYGKTSAELELSYVLVKPIALEEYIEQAIYNLQIWSLVD